MPAGFPLQDFVSDSTDATASFDAWPVYRRLMRYAAPHWRMFVVALLAMLLFAASEVSVARLIKPLTDGSFIDRDPDVIRWMPWAILGLFLVRGVVGFLSTYAMAAVGQAVVSQLRREVFAQMLNLPVAHHDRSRTADLQAKLTYHTGQIAETASKVFADGIRGLLTAIGLVGLMLYTSWKLTLFVLLIAPLVSWSVNWVNRRFRTISARIQTSVGGITHAADEAISGRRVLKVYGGESLALGAFGKLDDYLRRNSLKMTAAGAASNGSLELIAAVGVSALVWLATQPSMLETMTPGTFVSFIGAMLMLRQPLSAMTGLSEKLQRGLVAGADLFDFLDAPVEQDLGTRVLGRARGEIAFEDVRFAYSAEARAALAGVSLRIPVGSTVAFVGKSGSGKSTLLSLIPRFYEPSSGRVLLDGHDLRDYPLRELRRQIALVDQNIVLFNATVGENIAYGAPDVSRAQIEAAARRAQAWDFIQALPQGLDTPIGQAGVMISGGQRQRLTIARALLKDAPILILDEATSALDSESERAIQQGLEELMQGRTTLVIAHRLSTIQTADLIVVMHEGRIVEQGSHAELLARDGAYAALHRLQFHEDGPGG